MQSWGDFLDGLGEAKVIDLRTARRGGSRKNS